MQKNIHLEMLEFLLMMLMLEQQKGKNERMQFKLPQSLLKVGKKVAN